jgi:hypothetical protein
VLFCVASGCDNSGGFYNSAVSVGLSLVVSVHFRDFYCFQGVASVDAFMVWQWLTFLCGVIW